MAYVVPQQQYQSSFVPYGLGVIQQNLGQRQQRYDATSTALAQAKAGLYDMDTYDPTQKAAMIKMVEDRFGDIYSRHSGDLGAAATDVMDTIADIRSHPYFSLNKAALEKQKQQEALIQQYGPDALKFATLPQGLSADGKWREQGEFAFDIEKGLDYAQRLAPIWKDALHQVVKEGKMVRDPETGMFKSTITSGIGIFGQLEDRKDEVLNEYKSTAEYTQQKKKLMKLEINPKTGDHYTEDQAEDAIKQFVLEAGKIRVSPESYKIDYRSPPTSSGGLTLPPELMYSTSKTTTKGKSKMFSSSGDILKGSTEDNTSFKGRRARKKINQASNSQEVLATKVQVIRTLSEINPDLTLESLKSGSGRLVVPFGIAGDPAKLKTLNETVHKYNKDLEIKLSETVETDYQNYKWNTFDVGKAFDYGGKDAYGEMDARSKSVLKTLKEQYVIDDFIFEVSPLVDSQDNFSADERKNWDIVGVSFGSDVIGGEFAMNIKTNDGESHIVKPKSLAQAIHITKNSGDPNAKATAISSTIEVEENSILKLENGSYVEQKLPEGVSIKDLGNGFYVIDDNGSEVTTKEQTQSGTRERPMLRHEVILHLYNKGYVVLPELDQL